MVHDFNYLAPRTLSELFDILAEKETEAKILAGGTDLLVNIRSGIAKPRFVVDIKNIPGAAELGASAKGGLSFGPAVTINAVLAHPVVQKRYPLLAVCAHNLASYQVRNRATVLGNIVNASPCSDMAPALLCLNAIAVIAGRAGRREVPLQEFFQGVKKTVLTGDEVLERIIVPAEYAGGRGGYRKLKRISGHDLGIIGVALLRKGGRLRFAVSSAAPTPVFAGDFPESTPPDEVAAAVLKTLHPIDDVRCSREYREFIAGVYVRRLMAEVK